MKLQCASFRQNRLKRLDAETMQRRGAVQENGVLLDDFFEHIPDFRARAFDHVLGTLDVLCESGTYEPLHDERFEEFERHFLRQTTLMKLELRTDDDDGASRIVHALTEKLLAEASLFAFEHVGKRLQRAVARSRDRTTAAAVVNQSVNSLLQHAFFVADDDIRSTEIQETLQTIVAVDDAAIKIVQIARRKTSAVELNHGAQLGRNDGDNVENHPGRLVAGFAERLYDFQAANRTDLALSADFAQVLSQFLVHLIEIEFHEKFLHSFSSHANAEGAAILGTVVAVFTLRQELLLDERRITWIEHDIGSEVEHFFQRSR